MNKNYIFSKLNKTWLLDIDGTLIKNNEHLNGGDVLINGVKDFFKKINANDTVILLTSRNKKYKEELENFLQKNGVRFDNIIYDLPFGERILVNDEKNSGLKTAYAINKKRDEKLIINYVIKEDL